MPMRITYLSDTDPILLATPALGEISGGIVRLCCPYIVYKLLEAKFSPHVCNLSLDEGEELTEFLCANQPLCTECDRLNSDELRGEMAFESFLRGDVERAIRIRERLQDTGFLDDMCWSCGGYAFPGVDVDELRMRNDWEGLPPVAFPDKTNHRAAKVVSLYDYFPHLKRPISDPDIEF